MIFGPELTIQGPEFPEADKVSDLIGNSFKAFGVEGEEVAKRWKGYLPVLNDKKVFLG